MDGGLKALSPSGLAGGSKCTTLASLMTIRRGQSTGPVEAQRPPVRSCLNSDPPTTSTRTPPFPSFITLTPAVTLYIYS